MTDFSGFKDSYIGSNSDTVSGSSSMSPAAGYDPSRSRGANVPSIQIKRDQLPAGDFLSQSLDIKKQLSQSFGGSYGNSAGISKPHSRKNSIAPSRSNNGSDDEDDEQGNERKRRDNINEKIQELLTLIPSEFFQEVESKNPTISVNNPDSDNDAAIAAAMKNSGTKDGKPNKGQILTKSVEYLQYLQNLIDENNRREVELQMKLKKLKLLSEGKPLNVPITIGNTSAEYALGEIGVGPISDDYFKQVLVSSAGSNKSGQRRGSVV